MKPRILNFLNLLWTFFIAIRATDMFSAINATRQLFQILRVSVRDVVPFMIVTFYIMCIFAMILQYQALINQQNEMYLIEAVGVVFGQSLGGFDIPGVSEDRVIA